MRDFSKSLAVATAHLRKTDPVLRPVIDTCGMCTITPHTNYYHALIDSIIGQQLSVKAARTIRERFYALFDGTALPEPTAILAKSIEELRTAGLSGAKARYIQDLALHVADGSLRFSEIDTLHNDEIVRTLTAVKGIGEWTAHMFMMFCMGRLDVLPTGDLGIKNGIMKLYALPALPTPDNITSIATKNSWHPYESVASWYIWRSLEATPQ